MEIADQLCEHVQRRQLVEIITIGDPPEASRLVEPHAVYIGSNNRGFADFWQRSGHSESGELPGWRRFALSDILSVTANDEQFDPRPTYRPENRAFYRAFVCSADRSS